MNSVRHIRDNIFELSQVAFAEIAGVSQATVSRWENGELEPNRDDMERIHTAARERGLELDYETFFIVPPVDPSKAVAPAEKEPAE